jgi:zinc/manganese transport system substrate-binding protein
MKQVMKFLLLLLLIGATFSARAAVSVLACEPEWGALSEELGGDKVSVYTATNALQDRVSSLRRAPRIWWCVLAQNWK